MRNTTQTSAKEINSLFQFLFSSLHRSLLYAQRSHKETDGNEKELTMKYGEMFYIVCRTAAQPWKWKQAHPFWMAGNCGRKAAIPVLRAVPCSKLCSHWFPIARLHGVTCDLCLVPFAIAVAAVAVTFCSVTEYVGSKQRTLAVAFACRMFTIHFHSQ